MRPGRKVGVGEVLAFFDPATPGTVAALQAEVTERREFGERVLRFTPCADFWGTLDRIGHVPLPPYIHRADARNDRDRYQTVYAEQRGSVAAPTAGLHFTPEILAAIRARGVRIAFVTLHVGLGTFAPLRVETVEEIRLHARALHAPSGNCRGTERANREGRRIVAAGTTTVRTLEHCALTAAGRHSSRTAGQRVFFFRPARNSAWWTPCSPTSTCRNPACSCW